MRREPARSVSRSRGRATAESAAEEVDEEEEVEEVLGAQAEDEVRRFPFGPQAPPPSWRRRSGANTLPFHVFFALDLHDNFRDGRRQPIYAAELWYYNVHRLSDYTWQRGRAQLFPHMLVVRWAEASGLIAEVKLDLLSCVEVRTVRPAGRDRDVRVDVVRDSGAVENVRLVTFELGYSDSLERLGSETRAGMVAWFEQIQ